MGALKPLWRVEDSLDQHNRLFPVQAFVKASPALPCSWSPSEAGELKFEQQTPPSTGVKAVVQFCFTGLCSLLRPNKNLSGTIFPDSKSDHCF